MKESFKLTEQLQPTDLAHSHKIVKLANPAAPDPGLHDQRRQKSSHDTCSKKNDPARLSICISDECKWLKARTAFRLGELQKNLGRENHCKLRRRNSCRPARH